MPARSPIWSRLTNTNATIFQGKINTFGSEFTNVNNNLVAAGDPASNPQVQPMTDPNAYANYMPGGSTDAGHATSGNIAWGFFNPTSEGNFSQGTSGVDLNYIQLVPGTPGTPGTDEGIFQLSGDGNLLTFTPQALVPEPSSYVTLGVLGALALLGFQMNKRRQASNAQSA